MQGGMPSRLTPTLIFEQVSEEKMSDIRAFAEQKESGFR